MKSVCESSFRTVALVLLLMPLIACDDDSFVPLSRGSSVAIETLEDGVILHSTREIPISVSILSGSYNSKSMTLALYSNDGSLVGENVIEGEELHQTPSLELSPELPPGRYSLSITVKEDEDDVASRDVSFFIAEAPPHLTRISSLPMVLEPGIQALISLDIAPLSYDPWIRLNLDGETVRSGFLSIISPRLTTPPLNTSGAHSVRADIYPFPPSDGGSWDFDSPIYGETLLYVGDALSPALYVQDSENSYYSHYHFHGEYGEWGSRGAVGALHPIGTASLDEYMGLFGYRVGNSLGFYSEQFPLPLNDNGEIEPFSIALSLAVLTTANSQQLLRIKDDSGQFDLFLGTGKEGAPLFTVVNGDVACRLELGTPWAKGLYPSITLTVIPDYSGESLALLFYQGGTLLMSTVERGEMAPLSGRGTLAIAVESKLSVIMDEMGVFFRNPGGASAVKSDMFALAQGKKHGERLLFADGFDGLALPDKVHVTGDYSLAFSELLLKPGSTLGTPAFSGENREFSGVFSIDSPSYDKVYLRIVEENLEGEQVGFDLPVESIIEESQSGNSFDDGLLLEFVLTNDPDKRNVIMNGKEFTFEDTPSMSVSSVQFAVINDGNYPVRVDDLVILKEDLLILESVTPSEVLGDLTGGDTPGQ